METDNKKNFGWMVMGGIGALLVGKALFRSLIKYDFSGKVVLITGGSRGLGLVMARQLAAEGARLVLCSRDEIELENARFELAGKGADVLVLKCDVTVEQQVQDMVTNIQNEYGPIDVLINNAGIIQVGPVTEMTIQEFEEAMNVHFWGALHTILAVLPSMRAKGGGRILNVASVGGKISVPHLVPYCSSKFALVGLSEGLRAELKKYNIVVTTATPGLIRTGSPRHAIVKGRSKEEYALFKILDSNVLTSLSAETTSKSILNALRYGDSEVSTTIPAKIGIGLHGLSAGLMTNVFGLINKFLPSEGGIGTKRAKGYESESALSESFLTERTQQAAQRNNEI